MDGINSFGSLTSKIGQRLQFKDFDLNNDGKISETEFKTILKENNIDTVEFSTGDKNDDKIQSEDEFKVLKQRDKMETAIKDFTGQIVKDFNGKNSYHVPLFLDALKDAMLAFMENYEGKVEDMAEEFINTLPEKYEALKEHAKMQKISQVIDQIFQDVISKADIPEDAKQQFLTELKRVAKEFTNNYAGYELDKDLKAHLEHYLNGSDASDLKTEAEELRSKLNSFGTVVDNGADLEALKEFAHKFLLTAVKKGIEVEVAGIPVRSERDIKNVLTQINNGEELKAALEKTLDSLNTKSKIEQIKEAETDRINAKSDESFGRIKGSNYKVDPSLIDYSNIEGYNAPDFKLKTKGKSNNTGKIRNQAREIIENNLKDQIKTQISNMLKEKGVSFDKVANIFENIWNTSMIESLNTIDIHKTNHKVLNKKKKYASNQNIKEIIDNFVNTFNKNMENAIDNVNRNNDDIDIVDMDYKKAGLLGNGTAITDPVTKKTFNELYETGRITSSRLEKHQVKDMVKRMTNNLKPQLLNKAKNLCKARGIEFNQSAFDTIFNNSQSLGIEKGIELISNRILGKPLSVINIRSVIDTLTVDFKLKYTAWADNQDKIK